MKSHEKSLFGSAEQAWGLAREACIVEALALVGLVNGFGITH
jgi:hypothetical protein